MVFPNSQVNTIPHLPKTFLLSITLFKSKIMNFLSVGINIFYRKPSTNVFQTDIHQITNLFSCIYYIKPYLLIYFELYFTFPLTHLSKSNKIFSLAACIASPPKTHIKISTQKSPHKKCPTSTTSGQGKTSYFFILYIHFTY